MRIGKFPHASGQLGRALLSVLPVCLFYFVGTPADAAPAVRHVLLLQSLDRGSLVFDRITTDFRAALQEHSAEPVTVTEFVVAPAGFTEAPERSIIDFLQSA